MELESVITWCVDNIHLLSRLSHATLNQDIVGRKGNYASCNSHHFTCCRAPTSIFRSLPQLNGTRQKMNWHKCLREPHIRSVGSDPDGGLWSNSCVFKSVLSLTEVERLMDRSCPRGDDEEKKSLISCLQQILQRQSGGSNRICLSVDLSILYCLALLAC